MSLLPFQQSIHFCHPPAVSLSDFKQDCFFCARVMMHTCRNAQTHPNRVRQRGSHTGADLVSAPWQAQDKNLRVFAINPQLTRRWQLEGLHHACKRHVHVLDVFFQHFAISCPSQRKHCRCLRKTSAAPPRHSTYLI